MLANPAIAFRLRLGHQHRGLADSGRVWRQDMERELVIKVQGRGVNDDAASVLVYRLADRISLVATAEKGSDAEVILDRAAAVALANALKTIS